MKAVRLFVPSISFTFLGIVLVVISTMAFINLGASGVIENIAWFMLGGVSFCILMQIGMHFAKECHCDVNVANSVGGSK